MHVYVRARWENWILRRWIPDQSILVGHCPVTANIVRRKNPEPDTAYNINLRRSTLCIYVIKIMLFAGSLVAYPKALPKMTQKAAGEVETQHFDHYWRVADIHAFENVGVSNKVQGVKYLLCADCEMGPIGFHDTETGESYVALRRVRQISA